MKKLGLFILMVAVSATVQAQSEALLEQVSVGHRAISQQDLEVVSKSQASGPNSSWLAGAVSEDQNSGNRASVSQMGSSNIIELLQDGNFNTARLLQDGNSNRIDLSQSGNGHNVVSEMYGNGNTMVLSQTGNNNTYNMNFQGVNTSHEVIQQGNNINATQQGNGSRLFGITQRGNDMDIMINHSGH